MAYPTSQMAWALSAGFAKTLEGEPNLGIPYSLQFSLDGGNSWTSREMPLPPGTSRTERPYEGVYLGGVGNCEFISPVYASTTIWKLALTCESQSWMYTTTDQGSTWIISTMPAGVERARLLAAPARRRKRLRPMGSWIRPCRACWWWCLSG